MRSHPLQFASDAPGLARRHFLAAAAVLLLVKAVFAALLPMTGDEAYFTIWAANPDWGFYDHPPMVGWWLWGLSQLSGHPLVLRLPALLVPLAIAMMTVSSLRRFGETAAWNAGTLALLVPLNAWNVAITTDIPLMFFAAAAVAAWLKALRTERAGDWLLTGAMLAGALMSKYFAGLLALAIGLHLLLRPSRARLQGLALIVLPCLAAMAVHLWWNWQNCWPNLMFNLVNRNDGAGWSWKNPALYLLTVIYVMTPAVAWALVRGAIGAGRDLGGAQGATRERRALAWAVAVPLLLLGVLSAFKTVGLHWLAAFTAPAVMWFGLRTAPRHMARALEFAAVFAVLHYLVIGALAIAPLAWFQKARIYDGLVMTLRPQALNDRLAPYLDRYAIAAPGYSAAATIGFNLERPVLVFGPGSVHARQDDKLTDFRALAGRDILVVTKGDFNAQNYAPYFDRIEVRREVILGAPFHLVLGQGFRYEPYRDTVLDEIRQRWYAVPGWLPKGPCYFCDRYFPDRACHR